MSLTISYPGKSDISREFANTSDYEENPEEIRGFPGDIPGLIKALMVWALLGTLFFGSCKMAQNTPQDPVLPAALQP